jgi:hypothetical protein
MDKLLEEIVSKFNIRISTMVSDTIRSSYFVDGVLSGGKLTSSNGHIYEGNFNNN